MTQYKIFIKLISAYINNNYAEVEKNEIDWNEIYDLAVLHSLSGLVYLAIVNGRLCDDAAFIEKFKSDFFITVTRSTVQEAVTQGLIKILNNNKIRHIVFKGLILRDYYPDKDVRTMGDIDIVIDESNQDKVHELLLNNGFEYDEFASHSKVRNYSKNNAYFEMHTAVVDKNIFSDIDLAAYFKGCFDKSMLKDNFTYELSYEYHLIYLLVHMAKHFKNSGCGVRMVLDIAVFVNKFKSEINWDYIKDELIGLKLFDFTKTIFSLCNTWFDSYNPYNQINNNLNEIADYVIRGGVFGYENKNLDAIRINRHNESPIKRMFNLLTLIFPDYEHLVRRYAWAKNMPKWMLPAGWIRVWWYRAVMQRENVAERIKSALHSNKDADTHITLLDMVGLKDD